MRRGDEPGAIDGKRRSQKAFLRKFSLRKLTGARARAMAKTGVEKAAFERKGKACGVAGCEEPAGRPRPHHLAATAAIRRNQGTARSCSLHQGVRNAFPRLASKTEEIRLRQGLCRCAQPAIRLEHRRWNAKRGHTPARPRWPQHEARRNPPIPDLLKRAGDDALGTLIETFRRDQHSRGEAALGPLGRCKAREISGSTTQQKCRTARIQYPGTNEAMPVLRCFDHNRRSRATERKA